MTSQERFWQARLLSKESEHRGELSAIRQQLEALKATTEDAKADLAPSMKATDALPKQPVFEYSLEILSFLVCLFVCFKGRLSPLPDRRVDICSIPHSRESPLLRYPCLDPFYRIIETRSTSVPLTP